MKWLFLGKNTFYLVLAILFAKTDALAQVIDQYSSLDGYSTVDVEYLSLNPDEGLNSSIYLGFFWGVDGLYPLGFSTYKPTRYYFNAIAGDLKGFSVDGNIFFKSGLKDSKGSQTIKVERDTRYYIAMAIKKRKSYGFHLGYFYFDSEGQLMNNHHTAMAVTPGITLLRSKHIHTKLLNKNQMRRSMIISRVNLDFIYYFNRQSTDIDYAQDEIDEYLRKIGFRVYIDGKMSLSRQKARVGFHYLLGFGMGSSRESIIDPILGLGLGYNFNFKKITYKLVEKN